MANGAAATGPVIDSEQSPAYQPFRDALTAVCTELAQKVVFDAEGATRFIVISVSGARSFGDAHKVAQTVAQSSLLKCALWGGDANWGRAICAVGYAGVSDVDLTKINMSFSTIHADPGLPAVAHPHQITIPLVSQGQPIHQNRKPASQLLQGLKYVRISIDLGVGSEGAQVYTCDLSPDYVKFNGAYTT
jgi:glutamate N-acetyltransferase/amino-acid N-acetyltransferase